MQREQRPTRARPARTAPAALLLAIACGLGCASFFHKPRPDEHLAVEERPWRVRCAWVLPPSGEPDAKPGPGGHGGVWASDPAARRLVLDGRLEDGFLVVTGVRAASDEDERDVVPVPATAAAVQEMCLDSVARSANDAAALLHAVHGMRHGEDVEVPLVFSMDPARPRPASRLVVFGDSLSDDGNLRRRLRVFPSSPYWLGRFSNGPNWADHLATRTGVAVLNEAYGGAAATRHPHVPAADVIAAVEEGAQFFLTGSLDGQVRDYVERDLADGTLAAPEETVFVVWGGANDYIAKEPFSGDISTLLDEPAGEAGYFRVVDETVQALAGQVRRLHAAGARRIAVIDLPNLGYTPIVLHNTSYEPRGTERPPTDEARRVALGRKLARLSLHHNRSLHRALARLDTELEGATILRVEGARAFYRMIERLAPDDDGAPFEYGFDLEGGRTKVEDARSHLLVPERCYRGGYLGSDDREEVCPDPGQALFWDMVHPSSTMHCWIAFFVQRDLARAGWLPEAPSPEAQRAYCEDSAAAHLRPDRERASRR